MVCPKCETVLKDGEIVCPICGTPVDAEVKKITRNKNSTADQFTSGEFSAEADIKHTTGSNLNLTADAKNAANAGNTGNASRVKQNTSNKYNDHLKRQDTSVKVNLTGKTGTLVNVSGMPESSNMSDVHKIPNEANMVNKPSRSNRQNTSDSFNKPLPQNHDTTPNNEKKNSMRTLTVITVLAIVIITTVIAICFVLMNQSSKKATSNTVDADTKYTEALQTDDVKKQEKSDSVDAGLSKSTDDANVDTAGSAIADEEAAFFKAAAGGYTFASGAGGWATYLVIDENGRFEGSYHDSEMGAGGDDYDATMYVSNFSGQLSDVKKISDLEYTAYVESIEYQDTVGDQEIKDRVLYAYTGAYGIDYGKTLHFYMKGSDTANVDEHLIDWLAMPLAWGSDTPKTLPFNAFYNEEDDAGFFGDTE